MRPPATPVKEGWGCRFAGSIARCWPESTCPAPRAVATGSTRSGRRRGNAGVRHLCRLSGTGPAADCCESAPRCLASADAGFATSAAVCPAALSIPRDGCDPRTTARSTTAYSCPSAAPRIRRSAQDPLPLEGLVRPRTLLLVEHQLVAQQKCGRS